jgi:hypothetical protein
MTVIDGMAGEAARRQSTIVALARETNTEPAHVQRLYDARLAQLGAGAKVRSYLSVLASRNVRAELRAGEAAGRKRSAPAAGRAVT